MELPVNIQHKQAARGGDDVQDDGVDGDDDDDDDGLRASVSPTLRV